MKPLLRECETASTIIIQCIFDALPAPFVWIIMGLLNGDFYTCSVWPRDGVCNISDDDPPIYYAKERI